MKIKKLFWCVTLLLAGFAAGVCAGEWRVKHVEQEGLKRTRTLLAGREAFLNYRLGTYENAKRLLLDDIRLLDEMSASDDRYVGGESSAHDAMTNYVRLAKLEERGGDAAAKASYMREAVARCGKLARWRRSCAEDALRDYVDKLDFYPQSQPN
jgi:hypothetical protein